MTATSALASASLHEGPALILTNALSGSDELADKLAPLRERLAAAGRQHEIISCKPRNLDHTLLALRERALGEDAVVVVVGGDGTVSATARVMVPAGITMGIIPGGTFNLLARDQGIPEAWADAAETIVSGRVIHVPVGRVNDLLFTVNASLGLYPRVLAEREVAKRQFGRTRWVAVLAALRTALTFDDTMTLSIGLDNGEPVRQVTSTLFIGNNRMQLARVGAEASTSGAAELTALQSAPVPRLQRLRVILQAAMGRLADAPEVSRLGFRTMTVDLAPDNRHYGKTQVPRRYRQIALDGESHALAAPWTFSVNETAMRLIVSQPDTDSTQPASDRPDHSPADPRDKSTGPGPQPA